MYKFSVVWFDRGQRGAIPESPALEANVLPLGNATVYRDAPIKENSGKPICCWSVQLIPHRAIPRTSCGGDSTWACTDQRRTAAGAEGQCTRARAPPAVVPVQHVQVHDIVGWVLTPVDDTEDDVHRSVRNSEDAVQEAYRSGGHSRVQKDHHSVEGVYVDVAEADVPVGLTQRVVLTAKEDDCDDNGEHLNDVTEGPEDLHTPRQLSFTERWTRFGMCFRI